MKTLLNLIRCARRLTRCTDAIEPSRLPAPMPVPVPVPMRVPRFLALALLPALTLSILQTPAARAAHGGGFEATADGRLVDVQVLVDGRTAPLYFPTDGSRRRYFQAFRGRRYALAVTNNTGRRVGVLIAVDGLNVVNGERSNLSSGEAMYVLDPWERTVIRGWRSSLQHVREFVFVDEERSYAERTGQANGDLGWVRVLSFKERGQHWFDNSPWRMNERERGPSDDEVRPFGSREEQGGDAPQAKGSERREAAPEARRDAAGAAPEAQSQEGDLAVPRQSMGDSKSLHRDEAAPAPQSAVPGTGWGEKRSDPVRRVRFAPESYATDQLVLRYEYASGLRALGISPQRFRDRLWEREHGQLGFAKPPRW